MSLEREATWSMPLSHRSARCDWPWCWRRATQLCRTLVPAGASIVTFGRSHCDRHTVKRRALNLKVVEENTVRTSPLIPGSGYGPKEQT
jgi:hypothetical protein